MCVYARAVSNKTTLYFSLMNRLSRARDTQPYPIAPRVRVSLDWWQWKMLRTHKGHEWGMFTIANPHMKQIQQPSGTVQPIYVRQMGRIDDPRAAVRRCVKGSFLQQAEAMSISQLTLEAQFSSGCAGAAMPACAAYPWGSIALFDPPSSSACSFERFAFFSVPSSILPLQQS